MIRNLLVLLCLLAAYAGLFSHQEQLFQERLVELAFPLASRIQETALGYLKQLGGELLFIKSNVFLGGVKPGRDPYDYAESLTQHLDGASTLHPRFVDTYFICNSSLPFIGQDYAREANRILNKAMDAMPENFIWPFFTGFNYFYHLSDFGNAARFLKIASEKPEAPSWFGHLASTLAAEGGDIEVGVIWLRGMVAAEQDDALRERYQNSLAVFEQAAAIQQAIAAFTGKYSAPPADLKALVPEFVPKIPQFEDYELSYTPPTLRLLRPHIEEQLKKRQQAAHS